MRGKQSSPHRFRAGKKDAGYVYFIQAEDDEDGPIKIGWSKSPQERLNELQVASPVRLKILYVAEGGYAHEQALHRELAVHHLKGEWFQGCAEVKAAMWGSPVANEQHEHWNKKAYCRVCRSLAPLWADGCCKACLEFEDLRNSGRDPFDESVPRDLAA